MYHLCFSVICEGHSLRDIDCGYIPEHPAAAQVDPLRPYRELAGAWSACEDGPQDSLLSLNVLIVKVHTKTDLA